LVGVTTNNPVTVMQPNAILQAAAEIVQNQLVAGRSPILQTESQLITELPQGFHRPKISITLPAWRFQWLELAMNWIRGWRERLLRTFLRVYSRPTIAPT
jgi:hypothetical protein